MSNQSPNNLRQILGLEVPLVVRLGERPLSVEEVVALVPGAIIELPKAADAELDLLVNNKRVGRGVAVKVGENFGLRITFIGEVKERVAAMGGMTITVTQSVDVLPEQAAIAA
ncbi:MAG: FliM/FliN family flagellar motor switch protein [Phycisphaeraceae bacterium]|nr:FliM/FliN family flagellar motor switch protein [Phycisphaeraceae bacterium]